MTEVPKSLSVVEFGEATMSYYLTKVIEQKLPEIVRITIANNPQVDPEYISETMKGEVQNHIPELATKMNSVNLLLVDLLVTGREDKLRKFEVLFTDLLERTLLKDSDLRKWLSQFKEELFEHFEKKSKKD